MLPKSLHTVRVLAIMARHAVPVTDSAIDRVINAAALLGYPNAGADDPTIATAARQLTGERVARKVSP